MAELQQPDVLGSYLSNFRAAQQDRMAQQDRQRTIQRQDAQDERGEAEHDFTMMQRKNEIIARTAMAADTPEKWQQLVPAAAQQLGWSGELPGFDQRNRIIAESQSVADQIKQQMDEREFGLKERATESSIRANDAQAMAARALAGQRATAQPQARVLPQGQQTKEDEDIEAFGAARSMTSTIDRVTQALDKGQLKLGLFTNAGHVGRNMIGDSTPGSVEYARFMQNIRKMQNDILILHNGVQTEGDATRALQQIITSPNDEEVVKANLEELKRLNGEALQLRRQKLVIRRQRNQTDPFDFSQIEAEQVQPPSQSAPSPNMPRPRSPQERDALPSGTSYVAPDGTIKVKR